ncbi:MAG: hypothetical protein V1487_02020 [bacterium]
MTTTPEEPKKIFLIAPVNCGVGHKFAVHDDPSPSTPPWVFLDSEGEGSLAPDRCSDFVPIEVGKAAGRVRVGSKELTQFEKLLGYPACMAYCLVHCQHNTSLDK